MTSFSNEGIEKLLKMVQIIAHQLGPLNTAFLEIYKKTGDKRLPMIMDNLAEIMLNLDQAAQQIYALRTQAPQLGGEILEESNEEVEVKSTKVPWLKLITTKPPTPTDEDTKI